jgi:hypothetical protein
VDAGGGYEPGSLPEAVTVTPLFTLPLDQLQTVRDDVRERIRSSGRARAHDVETCLDISSRHVGVTAWAAQLERAWRGNEVAGQPPMLGLDHALLTAATPTLVFGSAVTALDQCVASAAFWEAATKTDGLKNLKSGSWYSTGDLDKWSKRAPTPFDAPPWFDKWFDEMMADPAWGLTKPFRNRQLHQIQPRSVELRLPTVELRVRVGGAAPPPKPAADTGSSIEQFGHQVTPGGLDVNQHYAEVSAFVLTHWTSFWRHF